MSRTVVPMKTVPSDVDPTRRPSPPGTTADTSLSDRSALSRPEQAAERLAELARAAQAGSRLGTKAELRAVCRVSVGTFNEALRLVQARGVVTVRPGPGGGLFASRQSPMVRLGNSVLALDDEASSVADAVRLRDALDPLLVQDALRHRSPSDVSAMHRELRRMKTAVTQLDGVAFVHANWALHARIAEVSPSPVLRSFYLSLLEIIESHTLSVLEVREQPLPEYIEARYDLHVALVRAITHRDDAAAARVVHDHNTTSVPGVVSVGDPLDPASAPWSSSAPR